MTIQIKHQNSLDKNSRATLVIGIPAKEKLLDMLEMGNEVLKVNLGVALVSPKDEYNKKVGREVAMSKIAPITAYLEKVTIRPGNRVVLHFITCFKDERKYSGGGIKTVEFGMSYIPKSNNARAEYLVLLEN